MATKPKYQVVGVINAGVNAVTSGLKDGLLPDEHKELVRDYVVAAGYKPSEVLDALIDRAVDSKVHSNTSKLNLELVLEATLTRNWEVLGAQREWTIYVKETGLRLRPEHFRRSHWEMLLAQKRHNKDTVVAAYKSDKYWLEQIISAAPTRKR
jgi:hypothetical protein